MVVYDAETDRYATHEELSQDADVKNVSGTELREMLNSGSEIPPWFSYPDVVSELRKSYPPASRRGFVVPFTGSDANQSAMTANVLSELLLEDGTRPVTLLGADVDWLTKLLVSREVAKNGGAVLLTCLDVGDRDMSKLRDAMHGNGEVVHVDIASGSAEYDMVADIAVDGESSSPWRIGQGRLGETSRVWTDIVLKHCLPRRSITI